jgi:hypothetical protein
MSPHREKARITLYLCFHPIWMKGFCFGSGTAQTDVRSYLKRRVEEECRDVTPCRLEIRFTDNTHPTNYQWTTFTDYPGLEAPRGCAIRKVERVARSVVTRCLNALKERTVQP